MLPIMLWQGHDMIMIFSLLLSYSIFVGIYFALRQWGVFMYSKFTIRITDDEICRELDIDDNQLSPLNRLIWLRMQANTSRLIVMRWDSIKGVTDKGTHWLLNKNRSNSIAPGIIIIPKEMENLDELVTWIKAKTNG